MKQQHMFSYHLAEKHMQDKRTYDWNLAQMDKNFKASTNNYGEDGKKIPESKTEVWGAGAELGYRTWYM